ncbi:NAD(P)-binding protein [Lentinula raphanica]|nr:NAD(P)-binding protein [Lentinula raphanica]
MAVSSLGVALITGASQGIGKAIALRLAKDGFRVALNDIPKNDQKLKDLARDIERRNGPKTFIVPADVSNESEVENMVGQSVKVLGGLDVMIANAGVFPETNMIPEYPSEIWKRTFAINVDGVFFCYKHAAKHMIAQGRGGRLIGASSIAGKRSGGSFSAYSASKFAVRGLTQSVALELAQHGITVNAYAPGLINSPMTENFQEYSQQNAILAAMGLSRPINYKYGEPEDIASLVSYLVSKEAHYITVPDLDFDTSYPSSRVLAKIQKDLERSEKYESALKATATKSLGVALVTGAAQGIGKAIALRLAKDGFRIALNDLPKMDERLKTVAHEIARQSGVETFIAPGDVSKESDVERMVGHSAKALGGIDVMIANAGILSEGKELTEYSTEAWKRTFAMNVDGIFFCYKYAAKEMIAQGRGGRLIGASSVSKAAGYFSAYSASKFAVRGLTQSVALELAAHKITANAYAPGFIKTALTEQFQNQPGEGLRLMGLSKPVDYQFGEPEDIASLVSYLASKDAHYITGQTISPNGGLIFS